MRKKVLLIILSLISVLACALCLAACGETSGSDDTENLIFEEVEGGYAVVGYKQVNNYTMTIPKTYNGKPVVAIADHAFYECGRLSVITIPEGVTSIGDFAFYGCYLAAISIPDSIESIGESAFDLYSSNHVDEGREKKYGNAIYWGNGNNPYVVLMIADNKDITSCEINEKTKVIYDKAFSGCASLTEIEIPDSVTCIGNEAFKNCDKLTVVSLPEKITRVSNELFAECDRLTSVIIPGGVTAIGKSAFSKCELLSAVNIPDSVVTIGSGAFLNCEKLKYNTIDGIKYLGSGSNPYFILIKAEDKEIASCTVKEQTKIIYGSAFFYRQSLTNITLPEGLTSIGGSTFNLCYKLTDINFKGTKEQWLAIEKEIGWDANTANYTVTCTDGTLTKITD
ncbi:MAG: leucine-rich repeat domain-containing protein [Clostridiales bacterium]|nr:leucine-rich repeat domain-containing protein [Clostridiales bacterium]